MKKKIFSQIALTAIATVAFASTSFADGWIHDGMGWWYSTNDANTTWHASSWQWLDGNKDGKAECYYFDPNGYVLIGTTTPDGYTVNADGAWTVNGAVQSKDVAVNSGDGSASGSASGVNVSTGDATTSTDYPILITSDDPVSTRLVKMQISASYNHVVDNGGYNEQGISNVALYALWHKREENKKFGELVVDCSGGSTVIVWYKNGLRVDYAKNNSTCKVVSFETASDDKDVEYMRKYVNCSDGKTLKKAFMNAGIPSSNITIYGDGIAATLTDGTILLTSPRHATLRLPSSAAPSFYESDL